MAKKLFQIRKYSTLDKWITIEAPELDLNLRVDFDDVDHRTVRQNMVHMVQILNTMWEPEIRGPICPTCGANMQTPQPIGEDPETMDWIDLTCSGKEKHNFRFPYGEWNLADFAQFFRV